jgi:hypothetical protein
MRLLLLSIIINAKRSTLRISSVCFQQTTFFANAKAFMKKHKKPFFLNVAHIEEVKFLFNAKELLPSNQLQTNAIIYECYEYKMA